MQLFLQSEQLHCIEVEDTCTLGTLKEVIQTKEGLNVNEQVRSVLVPVFVKINLLMTMDF